MDIGRKFSNVELLNDFNVFDKRKPHIFRILSIYAHFDKINGCLLVANIMF
jgi:hypothetical protein